MTRLRRPSWWLLRLAAALVLLAGASARAQSFRLDAPERYTLPNGLQVILSRDDRQPSVAVWMRYDVGSRDDPALLAELFAELVHGERSRALDAVELRTLEELWRRHSGDVRSCLLDLYERFAA